MTKDEALNVMAKAIEEGWSFDRIDAEVYPKIKEALAQPEQEPCGGCDGSGWIPRDPDIGTDQECFVCEGTGKNIDTTPPQRKPLTDEQRDAIARQAAQNDWHDYKVIDAVEAAHGIEE